MNKVVTLFCSLYVHLICPGDIFVVVTQVRLGLVVLLAPVNITLAALGWWKMGYFVFTVIGSNKRLSRELAACINY